MQNSKTSIYKRSLKRPMGFLLSLFAIIFFMPILLLIAILVKIKLGSPILFKQKRPGLNEKIFTIYKFRTMTDEKNKKDELLPDSVRLTNFGSFLRSTSLDELPSLFNILKGDMSLIGPRPLIIRYLPYYTEEERIRHSIRPGLTGLSQVSGRNLLEWNKRLELDVYYTQKITLKYDIYILFLTLKKVLQRKDIVVGTQHVLEDLDVERRFSKKWK